MDNVFRLFVSEIKPEFDNFWLPIKIHQYKDLILSYFDHKITKNCVLAFCSSYVTI